ncbi:ubiquitin carboxyl-terminal hydrolase 3 isoform X1 [Lates calcarifer]|uniref:Ubiquitin carboxyl-terminal hydrolase 3 isoform X1 n=1 Tax=Lates calcarifer TaxID=8187 RepID=A0AAJ8DUM0_LATCA|nr:ubiquitin carboxyl-terminal hydrolase 3 isoform X1 [Lates calcarifer]
MILVHPVVSNWALLPLRNNCDVFKVFTKSKSLFLCHLVLISSRSINRVLVLHLKRFRYTPTFQLEKIHDPVDLQRELVVSSGQDGACYSLISTINHIGTTARSGHYICDGVDPDVGPVDLTDRWFTYNDTVVTQTSGVNVCNQRQRSSYILFYRRQPED